MTLISLLVIIAAWPKQLAATVCRAHPSWCRTSSSLLDWGHFSRIAARNATFSHRRQKCPLRGAAGAARRNLFQTCPALMTFWRNTARKFFLSRYCPQRQPRRFVHLRPLCRAASFAGKPIRLAGVSSRHAVGIEWRQADEMRRRPETRSKCAPARLRFFG